MSEPGSILSQLAQVIADRKANPSARSYTAQLLAGGTDAIGAKIIEEAAEVVDAARAAPHDAAHLVHEAADLVYHLLVMLGYWDVPWTAVEAELARRFGTGGLVEKASRRQSATGDDVRD